MRQGRRQRDWSKGKPGRRGRKREQAMEGILV